MVKHKFFTPVQVAQQVFSIVENADGAELARYCISPYADLMENAELSAAIMEAYETYLKGIQKRLGR